MKFIHLSDLHIGKKVNEISMIEEQKYILDQIVDGIKKEKPDAVLISGDVYDKTTPPLEGVLLLDSFLNKLDDIEGLTVIIISGNHDSAERLSFGSKRMKRSGLYIKSIFDGDLSPVVLEDEYGKVYFYSLPFIRRADVNYVYDKNFTDYSEAISFVVQKMGLDVTQRNVLLSHQAVAGSSLSESETAVGGIEDISKDVYAPFDYTALGHIHKPQNVGSERLRYCGTPLKYNIKEVGYKKSYTVVELKGKNKGEAFCEISIRETELVPRHDMIKIEGYYDEIMMMKTDDDGIASYDYVYVILKDDDYINDAAAMLRKIFPNYINVNYDNKDENNLSGIKFDIEKSGNQTPEDIFVDFYSKMHGDSEMNDVQRDILNRVIEEIWKDEE